jgi:hypothetical protein
MEAFVRERHTEETCCWISPGEALACAVTSGVDLAPKLEDAKRVGHHLRLDEDGRRARAP